MEQWLALEGRNCKAGFSRLSRDWGTVNGTAGVSLRVSVVVPGERRVGIAADFPEPFLILVPECDLLHPLRPFPRVALRNNDSHRPAVLLRERLTVPFIG